MRTAYELATHSRPFTDFELLVKVQKQNGVPLLEGKQDRRIARELCSCLADVITDKVSNI